MKYCTKDPWFYSFPFIICLFYLSLPSWSCSRSVHSATAGNNIVLLDFITNYTLWKSYCQEYECRFYISPRCKAVELATIQSSEIVILSSRSYHPHGKTILCILLYTNYLSVYGSDAILTKLTNYYLRFYISFGLGNYSLWQSLHIASNIYSRSMKAALSSSHVISWVNWHLIVLRADLLACSRIYLTYSCSYAHIFCTQSGYISV
jgi:hypothetical protein